MSGDEAERSTRDQRASEVVALLDERGEDVPPLADEHRKPRQDRCCRDEDSPPSPRCQDAAHGWTGTLRGRLLPRGTTTRRPCLVAVCRAAGAAAGRICGRSSD